MSLIAALAQMDTANDEQWTADGKPKLEVVAQILGEPTTRAKIKAAAPDFSRTNPELYEEDEEAADNAATELEDADLALAKAQAIKEKAQAKRDAEIEKAEAIVVNPMDAIKAFQKSQLKQRTEVVANQKAVAALLKDQYKA
ncbi:MAG: hypothetical protein GY941_19850 [Planctomycetes bacterium]|nr:hypothetical protein [Planctomycetota bacterium]